MDILVCPQCGSAVTKKGLDSSGKQRYFCKKCGLRTVNPRKFQSDKKHQDFNWREWSEHLSERQELTEKATGSQNECNIILPTEHEKIIIFPFADTHLGSIGSNYDEFVRFTDEYLLKYDNLYMVLVGDMVDKFSQFKNMLAVHQMIMTPQQQDDFIENWLQDTKHKILFATWGNHEAMQEKASGQNGVKNIFIKQLVYFNGIGIANIKINDINYGIVATHLTRGNSAFNKTHGLKRIAREDIPDYDIYISAHNHTAAFEVARERGLRQTFLKCGTLKINDGHARRYYSYNSSIDYPVVVLNSTKKLVTPFWTLDEALDHCGLV